MRLAELNALGVLTVSGADAQAFLHGQLTADIRALAPNTATTAAWCNAKGRVLASLIVLHLEEEYRLILDRAMASSIARRLAMYVLRSRVQISDVSDRLPVLGLDGDDAPPAPPIAWTIVRTASLDWLCLASDHWLGVGSLEAAGKAEGSAMDWRAAEIALGRAWIGPSTQEAFTPQMINLDLNGGVSFTKGCYPGQEIVARTHYLGKVKRRMRRARLPSTESRGSPGAMPFEPQIGMAVCGLVPDTPALGQVVDLARCADGSHELLYVATLDGSTDELHLGSADGPRLEPLDLPYSID